MSSVGGVTVEILRGNRDPLSNRVDVWIVPGRAGVGAHDFGRNQSGFAYQAVLYGARADVESRLVALAALQASIVNITDDFGEARAGNLLTAVGVPARKAITREGAAEVRAQVALVGVVTL